MYVHLGPLGPSVSGRVCVKQNPHEGVRVSGSWALGGGGVGGAGVCGSALEEQGRLCSIERSMIRYHICCGTEKGFAQLVVERVSVLEE